MAFLFYLAPQFRLQWICITSLQLKIKLLQIFSKILEDPSLGPLLLMRFWLILFCFVLPAGSLVKKEESFMKRVSMYLLQIHLLLSNGKERRKSMFSYINKDKDLRNNGMQISLWLRNLKLCFFSLLSMQRIESFSECFVQSKGSMTQIKQCLLFSTKFFVS